MPTQMLTELDSEFEPPLDIPTSHPLSFPARHLQPQLTYCTRIILPLAFYSASANVPWIQSF